MAPMTATTTRPEASSGTERRMLLPEGWLRGLVAALEAVLLGWLVCVVPAIAAYTATAASPALGEYTWHTALGLGSAGWLLGHGAPAGSLSLVPLGLSAVFAALVMLMTRRHILLGGALVVAGVGYVGLTQAVSLLSPYDVDHMRLAAGSAVVAVVGCAWSWWRAGARTAPVLAADAEGAPSTSLRHRGRLVAVRAARGAGATTAVLVTLAMLAVAAAVALHADRALTLHQAYDAGVVGGTVLVLGQLAYVPTAGVWALSYLAGSGFGVGTGTTVAPTAVELGTVPSVPLLGALPGTTSPLGLWPALLLVLAGAAGAWWAARPGQAHRLVDAVAATLASALTVGLATLVVAAASSGAIGSGRMAALGPDPVVLAGLVAVEVAVGALVTTIALHPRTHAGLGSGARSVRERLRRPEDDGEDEGTTAAKASAARTTAPKETSGKASAAGTSSSATSTSGKSTTAKGTSTSGTATAKRTNDSSANGRAVSPGRWNASGSMASAPTPGGAAAGRAATTPGLTS